MHKQRTYLSVHVPFRLDVYTYVFVVLQYIYILCWSFRAVCLVTDHRTAVVSCLVFVYVFCTFLAFFCILFCRH